MLAACCWIFAGISCGAGIVVFVVMWLLWPHRTDGLAKPGGAMSCRVIQSTLFASAAALLWWLAPVIGAWVLVARWRQRRARVSFEFQHRRIDAEDLRRYMRVGVYGRDTA